LAAVSIVASLAGCAGSDSKPASGARPSTPVAGDHRAILDTLDSLQAASRKGDGKGICQAIFTLRLARSIATAAKRGCAEEVRQRLFSPAEEISVRRDIRVHGAGATAVIQEQNGDVSTLSLLKQSGRWRIDQVTAQAVQ